MSRPFPERVTLREFLERGVQALGAQLSTYIETHRQEHAQLAGQVEGARRAVEARLDGMNELRSQITAERGLYVTRDYLDSRLNSMNTRIDDGTKLANTHFETNSHRIQETERARANLDGRFAAWGLVLTAIAVIVPVLISILAHFWPPVR